MENDILELLEESWDLDTGFLGKLRDNIFDERLGKDFIVILKKIDVENLETLEKRMVSLLWYIPLFMGWQKERLVEKYNSDDITLFEIVKTNIENELERILGIP